MISRSGWVAERSKAPVLKTGRGASPSWVRIPPHPPFFFSNYLIYKDLSRLISFESLNNTPTAPGMRPSASPLPSRCGRAAHSGVLHSPPSPCPARHSTESARLPGADRQAPRAAAHVRSFGRRNSPGERSRARSLSGTPLRHLERFHTTHRLARCNFVDRSPLGDTTSRIHARIRLSAPDSRLAANLRRPGTAYRFPAPRHVTPPPDPLPGDRRARHRHAAATRPI